MRIKGSDLRKIIKEEITRAVAINETSVSDADSIVDSMRRQSRLSSDLASYFVKKFSNLVRHGKKNELKDALTSNSTVRISGKVAEENQGMWIRCTEMTVDGIPMPESIVDYFSSLFELEYEELVYSFSTGFNLGELDLDLNILDVDPEAMADLSIALEQELVMKTSGLLPGRRGSRSFPNSQLYRNSQLP
jgi:hypothetical protein